MKFNITIEEFVRGDYASFIGYVYPNNDEPYYIGSNPDVWPDAVYLSDGMLYAVLLDNQ